MTHSCLRLSSRCTSDSDLWADGKYARRVLDDDRTCGQMAKTPAASWIIALHLRNLDAGAARADVVAHVLGGRESGSPLAVFLL